jgi:hypothetical protein
MDRDAILNRIKQLRHEIEFMVRQNQAYEVYSIHTIGDQQVHGARMQRLEEIKRELDEIKAGKFSHGSNQDA